MLQGAVDQRRSRYGGEVEELRLDKISTCGTSMGTTLLLALLFVLVNLNTRLGSKGCLDVAVHEELGADETGGHD